MSLLLAMVLVMTRLVAADPLDDARAQTASFISRASLAISGLAVSVASLAIGTGHRLFMADLLGLGSGTD